MAALLLTILLACAAPQDERSSPVGVPAWIRDLVLPGSELVVAPADFTAPIVLRIDEVYAHGDSFRYDLVYYGLDPGTFDLGDFLKRRDGSSAEDLPPIAVEISSVLPPGQIMPNTLNAGQVPGVGGYELTLWIGGALWLAGLVAILALGRKRRGEHGDAGERTVTLAERLRPLVEQAMAGTLSQEDRAQLELMLIAFWRRKLGLEDAGAVASLARLKEHEEAGPLLRQLEDWLHRPQPAADVDLNELLAPYRDLPADALEPVKGGP